VPNDFFLSLLASVQLEFVESVKVEMHTAMGTPITNTANANLVAGKISGASIDPSTQVIDPDLGARLDSYSLESIVELKISRVLDHFGNFRTPEANDLYDLIMAKVEKPLLGQVLRRTAGNQVHAARVLGINRNTLRKKMKIHGFAP